jgi:hypothetical protein
VPAFARPRGGLQPPDPILRQVFLGNCFVLLLAVRNGLLVPEVDYPAGPRVLPVRVDLAGFQRLAGRVSPGQAGPVGYRCTGGLEGLNGNLAEDQLLGELLGADGDLQTGQGHLFPASPPPTLPAPPPAPPPPPQPAATKDRRATIPNRRKTLSLVNLMTSLAPLDVYTSTCYYAVLWGWCGALAMPTSQSMILKRGADQLYGNAHDDITSKPPVSTASPRTSAVKMAWSFRRFASPTTRASITYIRFLSNRSCYISIYLSPTSS